MSEKYKVHEEGTFFVTLSLMGWIDLFTRRDYADALTDNINYCIKSKGLKVYAYCIMPSHVHLIVSSEQTLLSNILRDLKSFSAKQFIQLIQDHPQESRKEWLLYMFRYFANVSKHHSEYKVWQPNNHPISLFSGHVFQQKVDYIHNNPVVAGLVNEPQNYMYSSANPLCAIKLEEL